MRAKFVNEAIKHLSGRDEKDFQEDIEKELRRNETDISKEEKKAILSGDENLMYHVYSGVDAFLFKRDGKELYPPYLAVVAKNQRDAREKAAKILGQKLSDQVIGGDYGENYIYYAEFIPYKLRYQGYYGVPTTPNDRYQGYYGIPTKPNEVYTAAGINPKTGIYHIHLKEEHPAIFTTEKNEKIPMPYIVMLGDSVDDVLKNASIFMGEELKPDKARIKFIRYF